MSNVNYVTFTIVLVLFLLVTGVGFAAARWRRAENMMHLNEWGLGGRGFGTFVGWFLIGGDLYTAYTFIAVPAAVFGAGAVTGFFAVSYTIIVFPIALIFLPRLWSIARAHNYVTPADFVRGRYGSRGLSLAIAFTGILALLPYIALQLVGIEAVLSVMGVGTTSGNTFVKDLPLFVAFLVLAIFTYLSGLRAPALIAFVKDTLIYVMVLVAVLYIPTRVGGWGHIFAAGEAHLKATNPTTGKPNGVFIPTTGNSQLAFSTLALGSALALMVYPHAVTGVLSTRRRDVIKRNMALLPLYSVMLGFIALLGYVALADKTTAANVKKAGNAQLAVPYLFQHMFPSWFTGVAFSAIIIGALVPAAIMSIAAANLFTRNIFKEFFKPDASPHLETRVSQWVSLVVKLGALLFAVTLPRTFSINLQLLGGIWILQTFPSIVFGLFTRWFNRWALLAGWLGGMLFGTIAAYKVATPTTSHWAGSVHIEFGHSVYIGLSAIILNVGITLILTLILKAFRVPEGADETLPHQYTADPVSEPAPAPAGAGAGAGLAGTGAAGDLPAGEHRAGEDVHRLQAHEVVLAPRALRVGGKAVRVPEPGPLQLVTDAARVGEARLPHAQGQVVPERRLGLVREVVGRAVQHHAPDRDQLVELIGLEVEMVGDPGAHARI
jgi:solute:Na+ symporter, SSS family